MERRLRDLAEENAILKKVKAKLTAKIRRIHIQSKGIYGSPKITKVLGGEGIKASQKTVVRIMQENNIKSKTIKKYKATMNSNNPLPIIQTY